VTLSPIAVVAEHLVSFRVSTVREPAPVTRAFIESAAVVSAPTINMVKGKERRFGFSTARARPAIDIQHPLTGTVIVIATVTSSALRVFARVDAGTTDRASSIWQALIRWKLLRRLAVTASLTDPHLYGVL